jgi:hypothetical protein
VWLEVFKPSFSLFAKKAGEKTNALLRKRLANRLLKKPGEKASQKPFRKRLAKNSFLKKLAKRLRTALKKSAKKVIYEEGMQLFAFASIPSWSM